MTKSVYVIGGAGTGKSTFTQELLDLSERGMGPLEDLYQKPNSRGTVITLRGHEVGTDGMYLGCMRESFPGTDGLDRVSCLPGEAWLRESERLPRWIVGEGATLATRGFIAALHETTDLLLVHLVADDFIVDLRLLGRGSEQDAKFVLGTKTRAANLLADMRKADVDWVEVNTGDPDQWDRGLRACAQELEF